MGYVEGNAGPVSAPGVGSVPAPGALPAPGGLPDAALSPRELEAWIQEFHERIYRYAYRLAGNAIDAEDLTQQTFLIALQKGGMVRDPQKVTGWLYSVLRNLFLKRERRQTLLPTEATDLDRLPQVTEAGEWDLLDLQEALDALPEDFRVVVLMFYFEEASYREIAEQLQIAVGTVMSRLSRAKSFLRARWQVAAERRHAPPTPSSAPCSSPSPP
ncbi:MAG: RNA polymerase sigma factor [Pirellulales bacterium]